MLLLRAQAPPAAEPADDNGVAPEEEAQASCGDAGPSRCARVLTPTPAQVEFEPLVKLEEVKTQTHEEDEEVLFKMCAPQHRGFGVLRGRAAVA